MGEKVIGVPTMSGIGSSFKELAIGAGAGLALAFGYRILGGLAFVLAPLLIGSMFKGDTGKFVCTLSGVALGLMLLGGGGGGSTSDSGVM